MFSFCLTFGNLEFYLSSLQNLDKNNDGFLTKREFSKLLQHLTKEQVLAFT